MVIISYNTLSKYMINVKMLTKQEMQPWGLTGLEILKGKHSRWAKEYDK